MDDVTDFYKHILAYCKYAHITRKELADRAGVEHSTILYQKHSKSGPRLNVFKDIVEASGISADWWLGLGSASEVGCSNKRIMEGGEAVELKVKITGQANVPKHAKPGDAGLDLAVTRDAFIRDGETVMAGTGVSVAIPEGYVGLVFPRSGLASKKGVNLANCVGVIDSGYRGEIKVPLHACAGDQLIKAGERVCQLVVVPFATCECVQVDELDETERGDGGFGSTGAM